MRTCQLGAFVEAIALLADDECPPDETVTDVSCQKVKPRRRATLRLYGEVDDANELRDLKAITKTIVAIKAAHSQGDSATVTVVRQNSASRDGQEFPFAEGTIQLVEEGRSWRFNSYEDTGRFYSSLDGE